MNTIRTVLATALQLGIAAGVLAMILIQMRVAVRDEEQRRRQPGWTPLHEDDKEAAWQRKR